MCFLQRFFRPTRYIKKEKKKRVRKQPTREGFSCFEFLFSFFRSGEESRILKKVDASINKGKITVPISSLTTPIYEPTAINLPCTPLDNKGASKGEVRCREVLEEIYNVPFYRVRPSFLRNPESNRNLEIDCFNAELCIGCEYHGKQHYVHPCFPGHSRKDFIKQLKRDLYKIEACRSLGIYLIIVPYTVSLDNIEGYIRKRLP